MQQIEKIRSSGDQRYDKLLEGVASCIMSAISASHQSPSQVFMRYIDHAFPGESYHDWLSIEYRTTAVDLSAVVSIDGVVIPQYEYGEDVSEIFEVSPRVDGFVDDEYLRSVGSVALVI
jgi:hypothetical protein